MNKQNLIHKQTIKKEIINIIFIANGKKEKNNYINIQMTH